MQRRFRLGLTLTLFLALTVLADWGMRAHESLAGPAAARSPAERPGRDRMPEGAAPGAPQAPPAAVDPQVRELDDRIKALREEFHSQLDPLQAQVKALHDKYDPQLKDLEQQRRTLVEQAKPPEIQQLDQQEDTDLAALADREKAEIDKLKQRFTDERKELQQRYAERRKEAGGVKR